MLIADMIVFWFSADPRRQIAAKVALEQRKLAKIEMQRIELAGQEMVAKLKIEFFRKQVPSK